MVNSNVRDARASLLRKLDEYAAGRRSDVGRGAESPHLAALMLQKYGYGLCDAAEAIEPGGSLVKYSDVDALVEEIDPNWRENAKKRWAARPADVLVTA
ncbi:hypothetical protein APB26_32880 [Pseudomonas aeruginosa]|uniref:hypothetical protein n=1 Tax=Pseudomonas aeruginosa TaxID=287 RepID=UPI00071B1AE9|nr:hypothetical protein [Pseudomonas aeruginosa]KSQ21776.1 hypothetical protein APB26_32880 [Pseudomonas aeruginosa]RPV61450.1 hypothetical protein IPC838_19225 [Pseudomonas aeruginosa]